MIEFAREVAESVPSEAELQAELAARNAELAAVNNEAGRIMAEQRSAEHKVREAGKALQLAQARKVKRELTSGLSPQAQRRW